MTKVVDNDVVSKVTQNFVQRLLNNETYRELGLTYREVTDMPGAAIFDVRHQIPLITISHELAESLSEAGWTLYGHDPLRQVPSYMPLVLRFAGEKGKIMGDALFILRKDTSLRYLIFFHLRLRFESLLYP